MYASTVDEKRCELRNIEFSKLNNKTNDKCHESIPMPTARETIRTG